MQLVSARIWARIAVSISYDDNHYIKGTWIFIDSRPKMQVLCKNRHGMEKEWLFPIWF